MGERLGCGEIGQWKGEGNLLLNIQSYSVLIIQIHNTLGQKRFIIKYFSDFRIYYSRCVMYYIQYNTRVG